MRRPRRFVHAVAAGAIALAGLTCRDRSTTGPGLPGLVSLAVQPLVSLQEGEPSVTMARARLVVRRLPGGLDVLDTVANFPPGGELALDLSVPLLRPTEDFELVRSLVDVTLPEDDLFAGVRESVQT